jgi:hypothetical protein
MGLIVSGVQDAHDLDPLQKRGPAIAEYPSEGELLETMEAPE